MSKVKLDVLKPWITQKITEILKMEDDVVIDYVNNQLEEKVSLYPSRLLCVFLLISKCNHCSFFTVGFKIILFRFKIVFRILFII